MLAVDTNVLVRLFVADDRRQTDAALTLFQRETVWIAKTVLLEASWVLQRTYGQLAADVENSFRALLDTDEVQVEDAPQVRQALAMCEHGLAFADALHLASTPDGARFATFDSELLRRSRRNGWNAIEV